MSEVVTVKLSPNCSNIMYVERRRTGLQGQPELCGSYHLHQSYFSFSVSMTNLETDFSESLSTLKENRKTLLDRCLPQNLDDMC